MLGYPVCIKDRRYERNEFIFSIALVLEEEADKSSYVGVVRKLGLLLRSLEEQAGFLSREEDREREKAREKEGNKRGPILRAGKGYSNSISGGGKVYALCEMILEDLNNYCECMIPIGKGWLRRDSNEGSRLIGFVLDPSNTLNLKLFPARRPPPTIHAWHVPLSIVRLSTLARAETSNSWDLTLLRIIPYIDGVASVARISQLADADLNLTRKAVAHLVYYGCVILLDIFQFSAVYAPTADYGAFVESTEMQAECLRYVMVPWTQQQHQNVKSDGNGNVGNGPYEGMGVKTGNMTPRRMDVNSNDFGGNNGSDITLGSSYRSTNTVTSLTQSTSKLTLANPTHTSALSASTLARASTSAHLPPAERMQYLLIRLYASLKQGLTLRNWCIENASSLDGIDIRRFITFGVIKGFLYRVQKFAFATGSTPVSSSSAAMAGKGAIGGRDEAKGSTGVLPTSPRNADFPFVVDDYYTDHAQQHEQHTLKKLARQKQYHNHRRTDSDSWGQNVNDDSIRSPASPSHSPLPSPFPSPSLNPAQDLSAPEPSQANGAYSVINSKLISGSKSKRSSLHPQTLPLPLARYLDGTHCFDQICTELAMAERDVLAKIKGWSGDVQLIYR